MRILVSTIALTMIALVGAEASGQVDGGSGEGPDLQLDPSWAWSVEIKPMLWSPGLRGNFSLPRSSTIDVETVNIDETRLAPVGQFSLRADGLDVRFRGFGFSLDEGEVVRSAFTLGGMAVAPGDRVSSQIDFASFDLTVGYRFWTPVEDVDREVRLGIDLYTGLRVHSMSMELRTATALASEEQTWVQPIIGFRITIDLPHRFVVYASLDGGGMSLGDDTASSVDLTAGVQWRFLDNVGFDWGFRHHQFNLQTRSSMGDFEYQGSLAGLYGALVIRF